MTLIEAMTIIVHADEMNILSFHDSATREEIEKSSEAIECLREHLKPQG